MTKKTTWSLSSLAAGRCLVAASHAGAADWWMLQQTDKGRECGPPIEAVMVNCEGDIGRLFVFTKSDAGCVCLAKD